MLTTEPPRNEGGGRGVAINSNMKMPRFVCQDSDNVPILNDLYFVKKKIPILKGFSMRMIFILITHDDPMFSSQRMITYMFLHIMVIFEETINFEKEII